MTARIGLARLERVFEAAFHIRPAEFWRVQIFFLFFASIGMFYTIGTTVGDTLFLSRFGATAAERLLPWLFIGITVATVAASWLFSVVEPRLPRVRLIVGTQIALAISVVVTRQMLRADVRWLYFGLAVWLEVCALLSIMLFFSFAGDYFTSRDARRLYGYITGGLALGNVLAGYASVPLVRALGPDNLLYPCAAILLLGPFCVLFVARTARPSVGQGAADEDDEAGAPATLILTDRYLQLIFVMVAAGIVCSVLLNYQFKITAVRQMREGELAIFFGKLYAWSGVVQLVVQFAFVQWLLGRFGIVASLMILPALMLAGSAACFLYPIVMTCAITNGVRISLTETLDLPSRELLFLPLPPRIRLRAQAWLGGVVVPLGRGFGGGLLLALSPVFSELRDFALVSAGSAGAWIAATYALRQRYKQTLARSMRERQLRPLDLAVLLKSSEGDALVDELLRTDWPGAATHLLALAQTDPDRVPPSRLADLARSAEEHVAVGALTLLGATGTEHQLPAIQHAVADSRPGVRAAAALALCQVAHDEAVPYVVRLLEADEEQVRVAALAGCARYGGLDGALVAYPRLERLLHGGGSDRGEAALAAGLIGGPGFGRAVGRLLEDPDRDVRRKAIHASALLRDPLLVGPLVAQLENPELRPAAIEALAAMPERALPLVADHANDPNRSTGERLGLVQAIGTIGGAHAFATLWACLAPTEELTFRVAVGDALWRMRERGEPMRLDTSVLGDRRASVCDELALVEQARLECGGHDPFCASLLLDHARLQVGLLASLFALEYGPRRVRAIEANLFSSHEGLQANALELVEATLPRAEGTRVVPLLGSLVRIDQPMGSALTDATTAKLLEAEPWLRAIATQHHEHWSGVSRPKGKAMNARDATLYDLLPTVAVLKRADFFSDVPANYLASLAAVARPRTFYPGETLLRDGEVADALYVLCEGRVGIIMDGREVWQAAPPNCLGDISLLDREVEPVTAVALDEVRALRVSAIDFDTLVMTQPPFAKALLRKLARRVRDMAKAAYGDQRGGSRR